MRDSDIDDDECGHGDGDGSIDRSPAYVGCLVTKNTHGGCYDALLPANGREPFPNGGTLDERWMGVYDVASVGG